MSEKFSLVYFKTNQVINSTGMLYPKNGISSACGKKIIAPIAITFRIILKKFIYDLVQHLHMSNNTSIQINQSDIIHMYSLIYNLQ